MAVKLAGALVTGGIGLLAGTIGSRDTQITCLKCGNRFKAGEAVVKKPGDDSVSEEEAMVVNLLPSGKLQTVKWYKERHNCSLSEAKDAVDAIAAKHSSELSFANAGGSGCSIIILIGISITLGAMFVL